MKKELKMKHIFIPVIVVVIILCIVAAFLSNSGKVINTPTDGTFVDENGSSYHVHDDGSVHYGEH